MGSRAASFVGMTADQQNNTEVVAQVGGTATIKCYTNFLGDETVSWLKRDEDHLLTAGGQVYSSETRYSVSHVRHQKLWQLTLRDVKAADAGLYECQVTTHPPTSLFFTLRVVKARAVIQGGPEIHVHTGVTLRLDCSVEYATEPPTYIFWFHNGSMVNFDHRRSTLTVRKHKYGSSLAVTNVTWDDAGFYSCEPYLAIPANLTLHVVAGYTACSEFLIGNMTGKRNWRFESPARRLPHQGMFRVGVRCREKHAALHNGQNDNVVTEDEAPLRTAGSAHRFPSLMLIGSLCLVSYHSVFFQILTRDRL
ncbi:uncharacterized protein LOC134776520 [Penaeus indicus]|uniref:uncharacterized protein LOC134776520 n=1 Tax=Penaeus indicus TaxID=29960 RepID=UPI00300DAD0D